MRCVDDLRTGVQLPSPPPRIILAGDSPISPGIVAGQDYFPIYFSLHLIPTQGHPALELVLFKTRELLWSPLFRGLLHFACSSASGYDIVGIDALRRPVGLEVAMYIVCAQIKKEAALPTGCFLSHFY
jgi:hypothetical protein